MKRMIFLSLIAALLCATPVFAKDKDSQEPKGPVTGPVEIVRQQKELLVANINNLRNQELRVAILQQLLNEEVAKLRNIQAVFCDAYKLDVDKFRQGLYRYDERQGKFILTDNKSAK